MSEKIPFLDMFSHLNRRRDLAEAVAPWRIVSASIDKAALTIRVEVEGASGAGPNLLRDAQEGICRAYGLRSAQIVPLIPVKSEASAPAPAPEPPKPAPQPAPAPKAEEKKPAPDAFSRTEAIRQAAIKEVNEKGLIATPENSSYNELVQEAARLSITNGGDLAVIDYSGDRPVVRLKK